MQSSAQVWFLRLGPELYVSRSTRNEWSYFTAICIFCLMSITVARRLAPGWGFSQFWAVVGFVGLVLADLGCTVALYGLTPPTSGPSLSFTDDTLDAVLLFGMRVAGLGACGYLAVQLGSVPAAMEAARKAKKEKRQTRGGRSVDRDHSDDSGVGLLAEENGDEIEGGEEDIEMRGVGKGPLQPIEEMTQEEQQQVKDWAQRKQHIFLGVSFLLCASMQLYVAIKAVSFSLSSASEAVLMGALVLWINLEMFGLRYLVKRFTEEEVSLFGPSHSRRS